MGNVILLLCLLFFCHFLADYTHLSTAWMLAAKRFGTPVLPIAAHGLVHAFFTGLVVLVIVGPKHVVVAFLIQFLTHTLIDIGKGRINRNVPAVQSPTSPYHWYLFGFDQLLHSFVLLVIAYYCFV